MFGEKDLKTGIDKYCDEFASEFHNEKNLKCWEAVRAVPPTPACLKSPKCCFEVGNTGPENEMQIIMAEMQMQGANTIACNLLTVQGFDGNMLQGH